MLHVRSYTSLGTHSVSSDGNTHHTHCGNSRKKSIYIEETGKQKLDIYRVACNGTRIVAGSQWVVHALRVGWPSSQHLTDSTTVLAPLKLHSSNICFAAQSPVCVETAELVVTLVYLTSG